MGSDVPGLHIYFEWVWAETSSFLDFPCSKVFVFELGRCAGMGWVGFGRSYGIEFFLKLCLTVCLTLT
jgi:hypothetical protein